MKAGSLGFNVQSLLRRSSNHLPPYYSITFMFSLTQRDSGLTKAIQGGDLKEPSVKGW